MESFSSFIISEWKNRAVIEDVLYLDSHDNMTKLQSRASYKKYLTSFLSDKAVAVGVVCANIDDLKEINTRLGFQAGDYYIKQFALILQNAFSDGDVFRLNGDEFLAIIKDISWEEMTERADRITAKLNEAGRYTVSFGLAWDNVEKDLLSLIEHATQAVGVNKKRFYDQMQKTVDLERQTMLQELMQSIDGGDFEIYLQPKVDIFTSKLSGAEALIRYHDKEHGLIPPGKFIDALEKNNFIRYVDLFVFEQSCRVLERWRENGMDCPVISLNFSRLTLLEKDITTSVEAIFKKHRANKEKLEIEITESMTDMGKSIIYQAAHDLYRAGYSIALDDFGTKYTNLDILSELDFDMLKLDKGLINALAKRKNNQIILKNIISMCNDLDISVIAEGVESKEQERVLRTLGCKYAQGYLYGKPMPIPEFETLFLEEKKA